MCIRKASKVLTEKPAEGSKLPSSSPLSAKPFMTAILQRHAPVIGTMAQMHETLRLQGGIGRSDSALKSGLLYPPQIP